MSIRTAVEYVVLGFVVFAVVSLIAGSVLGQPILLSYVETGSMAPTLEAGDGFVAVPAQLAGPIQKGDVIVFEAQEIHGGGLTTHRVVGKTERGYITKGDANPFTDQDSDEPPVKRAQVVAVAWQPGGNVLVLPQLGTALEGIQASLSTGQRYLASLLGTRALLGVRGLAYLIFAVSLVWYGIGEWRARNAKDTKRSGSRETGTSALVLVGVLALLPVCAATAAMVGPAGTQQYGVISAEFDSDSPTTIRTGESSSFERPVGNGGVVPVVVYFEPASEGVDVQPRTVHIPGRAQVNATITLHAPEKTGYYRRFVTRHRYLAVIPVSTIDSLYRVHPWAPIVVIDALIGLPFYLVGVTLVDTSRVRNRSRDIGFPFGTRIRRALRGLY